MDEKSPLLNKCVKKLPQNNADQIYNLKNNNKIVFVNSYYLHNHENNDIFNPDKPFYRFCILFLSCFVGFGACICYDSPAPLQQEIRKDIDLSGSQFMALYSWYSWPNIILCFFGGYMIDKVFGIRIATFIFSAFVLIGNLIFALGTYMSSYWLMCVGRFVFGVGGESLAVAQNFFAIMWFKGKEINLVFGLQLSVSRLGSTVSFNALVPLYLALQKYFKRNHCLGVTFFIITLSCVVSFISAMLLIYMDWYAENYKKNKSLNESSTLQNTSQQGDDSQCCDSKISDDKSHNISLKEIKDFPLSVWLINIICVAYYIPLFTFIGLGIPFFQNKFNLPLARASIANSIVYIMSAFLSPLFGFIVDKVGRNLTWIGSAFVFAILAHVFLAFTVGANPFACMSLLGISYSILSSALWPLVSYEVPTHQLGTAYGLMQAFMNAGLALFSQVAGALVDYKGYLFLEIFFLTLLFVGLLANSVLHINDRLKGGVLDVTPGMREASTMDHNTQISSGLVSQTLTGHENEQFEDNGRFSAYFSCDIDKNNPFMLSTSSAKSSNNAPNQLFPRSSFYIRNRYLSRIGAQVPKHVLFSHKPVSLIPYHGGIIH